MQSAMPLFHQCALAMQTPSIGPGQIIPPGIDTADDKRGQPAEIAEKNLRRKRGAPALWHLQKPPNFPLSVNPAQVSLWKCFRMAGPTSTGHRNPSTLLF